MGDSIKDNKLMGDYKTAYFDILSYLQSSNISVSSKFSIEVQEDMKDMLLSAQENELPVNNIIGNDIKSFCEDIVQSHNTNRIKLLEVLKNLNFFLGFLIFNSLVFQILRGSINLTIVMVLFLGWFLLRYVENFFYKKLCLKFKGIKNKVICIILLSLVSVLILSPLWVLISIYCDFMINGFFTATISLLFILGIHIVCKKLDKNISWYSYLGY